ncbi:MAG: hypothetical protein CL823_07540 [Crocinitomicaceae bacterium]|nr:hypothetical protein [Crocinitomicaceae bacterium]|tara:strand:+ start:1831 stop:3003 length:1173 start_codon:yes stop_codon:yes gene_type:complete
MKRLKRFIGYCLIIGSTTVGLAMLTGHGYLYKGIKEVWLRGWSSGNIDDLQFAYDTRVLKASDPLLWAEDLGRVALDDSTLKWMDEELSASFLVISNDTIIYENYWRGHDENTLSNSFSIAKTIVALAIGLAVDDGLIDVKAPISNYIPRFADDKYGACITVEHVLQMRTCIPFGESYKDPFGFPARAYYGRDIQSLMEPYRPEAQSGTEFKYQSGNTILLAEILSSVQNKNLTEYVSDGLWGAVHAENDAEWGLDAVDGLERSFAQVYATTRDFARFGKLILDGGMVDSVSVISSEYIEDMITPIHDEELGVDVPFYGYQIWMGHTDEGMEFNLLRGHRGQYVLSVPEKNLIMVRTGYKRDMSLLRNLSVDTYIYLEAALKLAQEREQL